jgi:hypothetical protein
MKASGSVIILLVVFCGCSPGGNPPKTLHNSPDLTNEVRLLLAGLEGRPTWWNNEGTSSAASNRLVQLKHIAVPVLLDKLSSLNFRDDAEVERLGLACAILGTNTHSLLKAVAKQVGVQKLPDLPTEDEFFRTSKSLTILQLAGPCSFGPVIEVVEQEAEPNSIESGLRNLDLKKHAMYLSESIPAECMREFLRLYQLRKDSWVLRDYISSALRTEIYCDDLNDLVSVLRSLLQSGDDFLAGEGLAFLRRCGRLSPELKKDVAPLLRSSNAEIRVEATNVVNLPVAEP